MLANKVNRRKHCIWAAALLTCVFLLMNLASAYSFIGLVWNEGGVLVHKSVAADMYPDVTGDGSGGAVITWQEQRSGDWDIYARKVNSEGTCEWSSSGVPVCTATGDQGASGTAFGGARITSDGAGGAIITWHDKRSGSQWDIYAQRVDSNGNCKWASNGVAICGAANDQVDPQIASDGSGGALITWEDKRSGDSHIYTQKVDGSGTTLWGAQGAAVCTAANWQDEPQITSDGVGGAILSWKDFRGAIPYYGITVGRVDSAGNQVWAADGVMLTTGSASKLDNRITSDGSGGALVAWDDARLLKWDIYAQKVDSSGTPQWTAGGVGMINDTMQTYPRVASDGSGGAIVAWVDDDGGDSPTIRAQRVNSGGNLSWGSNGIAAITSGSNKELPEMTGGDSGDAFVVCECFQGGPLQDIYAQHIQSDGAVSWGDGLAVAGTGVSEAWPKIATDGSGGALVAWYGRAANEDGICAQRLGESSLPPPPQPTTTYYAAEGTCRPGFDPYICIQNPGDIEAEVKITYMKGDGSTEEQMIDVGANSRYTVVVKDELGEGDDAAHDFSTKVESVNEQPIICERPMYFEYKGKWTGGHDVVDATTPAQSYYFAEGTCRPGFDPYICIQNPGSAEADVRITYMKGDGVVVEDNLTVGANSRSTVTVKDKLGEGEDEAHDFSARVESTGGQEIICERPMYFNYKGKWTGGHDVVGTTFKTTTYYFAEGTCRPGFDTYICIQNPGSEEADVKITYMKGDGTTDEETLKVPGNSRSTVVVKHKLGEGDDPAHDFSSKVESTNGVDIIAERPMYFNYKGKWPGGHDVLGEAFTSSQYFFAEGTCRPGFDPYICIQNPGSAEADVRITYMKGDRTTEEDTFTVPKNSRYTVMVKDKLGEGDDLAHDFSSVVKCTNGQQIVCERPMYFNYKGKWPGGHNVVGL